VLNDLVNVPGYVTYRHDRQDGRQGGGVVCYVRDYVQCSQLKYLENSDFESLWLLFRGLRMPRCVSHVLIGTVYHPPDANSFNTVSYILDCLDKVTQLHPQVGIIVTGDFNRLNDRAILSYPLKQIVKSATRGNNILDKIYTNIVDLYNVPFILPPIGSSDHNVVVARAKHQFYNTSNKPHVNFVVVRSRDENGKAMLAEALRIFDWSSLFSMNDCEHMANYLYSVIHNLLDLYLPLRTSKRFTNEKPWVDDNFRLLIRRRQYAWKHGNTAQYNALRNQVQRLATKLRSNYYKKRVCSLRSSGPRQWWKEVKKLTGQTERSPLHSMAENLCSGDMQQLASGINNFFHSVSADLNPLDPATVPAAPTVCPADFIVEPYIVEMRLASIDPHKSCGPDEVPNWLWRDFSRYLAEPVCSIYNASIRQGVVPNIWKCANVVPIPKVNPPASIESDLRPISLTPTVSKILESIVGKHILSEMGNKIDTRQFGGLRGRSTTHALVDILHHWHEALNNNQSVRTLFIDYAKAFDHVDHNIVIRKLINLGVSDILVRWVCSFLSCRMQRVKLADVFSEWLQLKGSMPQGSWLGPLTFIILIDDLTAQCLIHKYFDDTTLSEFVSGNFISIMDQHIATVMNWSHSNLMNINWSKTKEMIIGPLAKQSVPLITVNDNTIQRVNVFKLLGVTVDSDLKWDSHVSAMCSKASSRLYFLKLLKRSSVSRDDLMHFYVSYIRPVLEYACAAWHASITIEQSKRIETIQRRAVLIITGQSDYLNYCKMNNFSTLHDRRELLCKSFFNAMLNTDNCLHYLLPSPRCSEAVTKLRSYLQYVPSTAKTNRFKQSYLPYALEHFQQQHTS